MNEKTIAIICLTIIGCFALYLRIDSGLLVGVITGIAGLAGYALGKST